MLDCINLPALELFTKKSISTIAYDCSAFTLKVKKKIIKNRFF